MAVSNILIKRGDTSILTVTTTLNGQPYSLTGHSIWFTAKLNEDDPDASAIIRKDNLSQGGITINTPLAGNIDNTAAIMLNPSDTSNLSSTSLLHYDVQVKSPNGTVTTVAEGILRVSNDVTRVT